MVKCKQALFTFITTLLFVQSAYAQWQLDNQQSQLNFISVKKSTVAENHRFTQLTGTIDKEGQLEVNVTLNSVDTKIAIRDERMKKFVFNTEQYSHAWFKTKLDNKLLASVSENKQLTTKVTGTLDFNGISQEMVIDVNVLKIGQNKLLVTTAQPFFIKADAFKVIAGINKLKELASLPSIDYVVPVSFSVVFVNKP